MPFARKLAIGRFDLSGGGRLLNAQDVIVVGHGKGNVRSDGWRGLSSRTSWGILALRKARGRMNWFGLPRRAFDEFDQCPYRHACRAFGSVWRRRIAPSRAGDIDRKSTRLNSS